MAGPLLVVAAVIVADDGRILLSRRHAAAHQGGKWEFPGGKVEPGESVTAALARELAEELGITPLDYRPLIQVPWRYPDLDVFLDVWRVSRWRGEPSGREGQQTGWFRVDELRHLSFPAANGPIVSATELPSLIAITPPDALEQAGFEQRLTALAASDCRIHLRLPALDAGAYTRVVATLAERHPALMTRLVLTSTADEVIRFGAAGLHLSARRLHALDHPLDGIELSASCHDPAELARAAAVGARYALLSPVLATTTHPAAKPLGWDRFAAWVREATMPVYALGGMDRSLLPRAWRCGAQGIAAIGGLWPDVRGRRSGSRTGRSPWSAPGDPTDPSGRRSGC